jgi:hypothetical protein
VTTFSNKRRLALQLARLGTSLAAIALAGSLAVPTAALAQAGTSTLRGRAPAGAEVVATEVNTGSARRTTVGSDGTYVIAGLQAGTYHVTAGGRAADVVVPVASEQVQNFDTAVAAAGAIVVTGTRPTAEVHTSQVNQFVTLHDIAVLPQVTRNFLEFADTVPGMQFQVDANHNTSLRGGAQLASAVNVYIDGVSQKDLVGGGSGITGSAGPTANGDPGNPFPQLAIAEYKVVTSNYSAEYGDAASSIIIAQTKSGTNRFQGEAFGTYTDQNLRARNVAEKASHTKKGKEPSKEYGAALSGPIVKDVAHFFVTWEHKSLSNQSDVFPGGGISPSQAAALLPPDVAAQYGPVTNPFTENLYFGKVDVEPGINDRIEATAKWRIEHSVSGGSGQAAASTEAPYVNDDKRADVRWQHSGNDWVNQVLLAYENATSSSTTTKASPQLQYFYFPNPASNLGSTSLIQVGGPGAGVGAVSRQRGWTLKDDFTFSNLHLAGDHTLRAGFSYGATKLTTQNGSSDLGNATYYYAVTNNGVAPSPYLIQFPNLTAGVTSASVTTTDKQYSAYVQDDWNVNRKLVLNLGLRWDHEVVPAFLNYVTTPSAVAAINGLYPGTTETVASVFAKGFGSMPGYNIFDYVSTGHNRKAPNNFSPRLGFSYDFNGDNRHVIFGGYGRAYNRNQFGTLALEVTKQALNTNPQIYFPSLQTQNSFGPCATPADINPALHCYAWNPAYLTPEGLATLKTSPTSGELDLLNNNLKTPHSDQFTVGMRNKIGDWNTQATASLIESYDSIIGRLANRYASGAYFQNGSPWGGKGVPGYGNTILFDNGGRDRNFQIGLAAQKPYTLASGWSATIAYTFSAAKQNNVAGGSNPYSIANNGYLFDLPYPSDYPMIRATAVPRHRLVTTYSRDLFWGISMASKLELATPPAAARIYCCTAPDELGNPQLFISKAPHNFIGYKDLDLQFTKNFSLLRLANAYVRVDILNVFNWKNYNPDAIYYSGGPDAVPRYDRNTFTGVPRTVKLTAGIRFGDAPPPPPPVVEAPPPPPPPAPPPATQTCADGSVILATATCPAPPPPPPPPAPAPERG